MMAPQLSLNTRTHFTSGLQYDTLRLETAQAQPMVLKCYILLRFVCFGLPPLLGVEERADHKLFSTLAKRRLHSTSRVRLVIFRRAEEITPPLMEILAQSSSPDTERKQEGGQAQPDSEGGVLSEAGPCPRPVFGVLTLSCTPATVRLAWRSEYVSRWMPSLVSPFP